MRKVFAVITLMLVLVSSSSIAASVATTHETWNDVVDEMEFVLDESYDLYVSGEAKAAKEKVDVAYYSYYKKLGFEKTVMAHISGNRAAIVEYQFSFAKKAINTGSTNEEVEVSLDELTRLLRKGAGQLDGKKESALGVFLASFLIITREGFGAIVIVGAIVAYLVKSGNKEKTSTVYWGSVIALDASVIMAFVLDNLSGASGASQETTEGLTMLLAVVVLFYVSNWMVSKSGSAAWTSCIEGKVQSSITRGSIFSLAFAAFPAVFREDAETILLYQASLAGTKTYLNVVWLGLDVGCVALVIIYLLIRFTSIKLPLKPSFLGTSILLFVMSISFVGSGVKELQEGNLVGVTPVSGITPVDTLGICPTLETLIPQAVLLALTIVTFVVQIRKTKKMRAMRMAAGERSAAPQSDHPSE